MFMIVSSEDVSMDRHDAERLDTQRSTRRALINLSGRTFKGWQGRSGVVLRVLFMAKRWNFGSLLEINLTTGNCRDRDRAMVTAAPRCLLPNSGDDRMTTNRKDKFSCSRNYTAQELQQVPVIMVPK